MSLRKDSGGGGPTKGWGGVGGGEVKTGKNVGWGGVPGSGNSLVGVMFVYGGGVL